MFFLVRGSPCSFHSLLDQLAQDNRLLIMTCRPPPSIGANIYVRLFLPLASSAILTKRTPSPSTGPSIKYLILTCPPSRRWPALGKCTSSTARPRRPWPGWRRRRRRCSCRARCTSCGRCGPTCVLSGTSTRPWRRRLRGKDIVQH